MAEAIKYGISSAVFYGDCGGVFKNAGTIQGDHNVDVLEAKGDVYDGYYYVTVHPYDKVALFLIRGKDKFYYGQCVLNDAPKDFKPIKLEKYKLKIDGIGPNTLLEYFKDAEPLVENIGKQLSGFVDDKGTYNFYVVPFGLKSAEVQVVGTDNKSIIDISRELFTEDKLDKINGAQAKVTALDENAFKEYMGNGYLPLVTKYGRKFTIRK